MEDTMTHYDVTINCPECEGAGLKCFRHSLSGNPETAVTISEIDCPACGGRGEITIKEVAELYENTQELLEDYPTALNVRLVA
tara:strand:+ start:436 stop:684 length:249 start_codon:yes stop_codon:yes gene_type:complete